MNKPFRAGYIADVTRQAYENMRREGHVKEPWAELGAKRQADLMHVVERKLSGSETFDPPKRSKVVRNHLKFAVQHLRLALAESILWLVGGARNS